MDIKMASHVLHQQGFTYRDFLKARAARLLDELEIDEGNGLSMTEYKAHKDRIVWYDKYLKETT